MFEFLKKYVYSRFFNFVYLLGLTFIIPFLFTTGGVVEVKYMKPSVILVVALFFIIAGIVGMYHTKKSWRQTFFSIGLWTLIPGTVSLLLFLFGKMAVFSFLEKVVVNFDQLKPLLDIYLLRLPRFMILSSFYVLLGGIFLFIGGRVKEKV
ncbi:MAG: hypothetical protein QF824_04415 [Candidatus Woesearchaeota archaeon]|nr:hypothetical protein [Candidatus Woesearchaeota archaeon]